MIVKLLTEHHLEFLSLTGGCTGLSESTHVKMPHCWKSHVTDQYRERTACHRIANKCVNKEGITQSGFVSKFMKLRPGHEDIKLFPCSTQLSVKFCMLINSKMSTIVGILTLIGIINRETYKGDHFILNLLNEPSAT